MLINNMICTWARVASSSGGFQILLVNLPFLTLLFSGEGKNTVLLCVLLCHQPGEPVLYDTHSSVKRYVTLE